MAAAQFVSVMVPRSLLSPRQQTRATTFANAATKTSVHGAILRVPGGDRSVYGLISDRSVYGRIFSSPRQNTSVPGPNFRRSGG